MALVADIQLQNGSIIPSKLDVTKSFTAAGLTATTGAFIGPTVPGSLSGLLTLKTANDTESWFQSTKSDGDVNFYINNDSDVYWRVSLSGGTPAGGESDSFMIQNGANPNSPSINTFFSIVPTGRVGIGTEAPDSSAILHMVSKNSSSASMRLENTSSNVILRAYSGLGEGVIETTTLTPLKIKSNSVDSIYIGVDGTVGIAGNSDAAYNLKVTGTTNITSNLDVGGALDVTTTLDVGGNTTITGDVLPAADSTHDIGSDLVRWREIYVDDITITNGISGLISNDADHRITTATGLGNLNAESGLTYDTVELNVTGDLDISGDFYQNNTLLGVWTDNSGSIYRSSNVGIGSSTTLVESWATGSYLTLSDATNAGHIQLDSVVANAADVDLGSISFTYSTNSANHKILSVIETKSVGATSNQRGGELKFYTKQNAVEDPAVRMTINSIGRVGISTENPTQTLDVNGIVAFSPNTAGKETHYFFTNATDDGRYQIKSNTTVGVDIQANGHTYFNGGTFSIGQSAVGSKLSVKSDDVITLNTYTTYALSLGNSTVSDLAFGSDATNSYIESFSKTLNINGQGSGNILFDTNTLYIDVTNNNVGIGTAPNISYALDVVGDINFTGELSANGNSFVTNNTNNYIITGVGNGTLNGEVGLTFNGSILSVDGEVNPRADSSHNLGTSLLRWGTLYVDTLGDNGQDLGVAATTLSFDTAATIDTSGANQLDINTGAANLAITSATVTMSGGLTVDTNTLVVDATNNNVGIGTTPNASYALDVSGDVNITGEFLVGGNSFITNNTDNYIITGVGNGTLNGEVGLTFNGTVLSVDGSVNPRADSSYDLGTNLLRWRVVHADTLGDSSQALAIAATTLSFDTAATIDTSGSNQLDINTGTANLVITAANTTISGDLTVDTTTLVVDSTNNNVGIGAAPNALYALDVTGDINYTGDLYVGGSLAVFSNWTNVSTDIYRASNVGIGSTSIAIQPWDTGSVLTVSDDASGIGIIEIDSKKADADATAMGALTFTSNVANTNHKVLGLIESATQGTTGGSRGGQLRFYTKADNIATPTQKMVITNDGKVGINDSDPSHTLDVTGDINFSGNLYQAGNLAIFSNWTINGANIYRDSNVGIGQISPQTLLHVTEDAAQSIIRIDRTGTYANADVVGSLQFTYVNDVVAQVQAVRDGANDAAALYFGTQPTGGGNTTRMFIGSDGKVGINTTVPGYTLHVDGDINFTGSLRQNGTVAQFSNWTINGANIYRSSNVGIGVTNPAERLEIGSPGTTSVTITNSLDTVGMKMTADTASAVISTTTDHPIDFKVNNTIIGSVDSSGVNLQSGKTYRIDGVDITLGGGGGGGSTTLTAFTINWPSEESTAINAHRLVFADLSDTEYCWNWEAAKRESRNKSWYTELGLPPTHSFLLVENNQNTLRWFNRNYETNGTYFQVYATFNTGVNDVIPGAINDVMFFDFKIYVGTASGLIIIDLLQDQAYKIDSTGQYIYNGNLSQRNDGLGWLLLNGSTSVINTAITNFDVTRDPNGNEDAYTRPFHYWAVATPGGLSLQKPYSSNYGGINDWNETVAVKSVSFLNKSLVWNIDDTEDRTSIYDPFADIATDGFVATSDIRTTAVNPYEKSSFTTGVTLTDVGTLFPADDIETILIGSNEGLAIRRSVSGETVVTDTYATPYMNEGRTGSYPLDGLNDRSGNGYTLTNQGSAVFTGLSPFGVSCVNLDGVDDVLKVTGQAGFGETVAISFYMKSASSTNPTGGNDEILSLTDGAATNGKLSVYTEATTGKIGVTFSDDNGSTSDALLSDGDIYDGNWHHVYLGKLLGDNTYWHLYVDGVMVARTTINNAAGTFGYDDLRIGTDSSETNFWAGEISQLYLSTVPYNESEIVLEYGRMRSGLGGAIATLTSSTIDTIETDSDSGYAIINAGNTVHLMDARTGLSYATDTVSVGSLNHADIRSMPEAVTPHYLIAGTNSIEQVAPDTNVLNGGVPLTEVQSNGISDLTAFSISWPEKVSVNYDAHKMYFVELNETKYCWDFEYVKRDSRNKSWYTGTPPTNGFMVVDAAQNVISWINRSYESNGQTYFQRYKNFVSKANNIVSANVVDIRFLDFKLYVATDSDGLCIIDFFQDKGYKINASGYYVYNGNVSEANDELGWTLLSSTLALVSSNTTSFDIVRDPDSKEDFYSRPIHYWAVGTDTGTSYHRPSISSYGDIFDSSSTTPVIDVEFINTSLAVSINDTEDQTLITNDFILIGADAWGSNVNLRPTPANPYEKTFFSTNAVISDTSSLYSPNNKETLLIGTDEGLSIRRSLSGEIGITSSYVTPLMDEGRVAVYPLNDVNDRSGNGYNLTNNGITFAAGPVGFAGVGNGSTWMEYNGVGSDFDVDLTWSFSLYTATNDTNIPAGNAHVAQIDGAAFPPTITIYYKSTLNGADSGKLAVRFDDGITTIDLQSTSPLYDAKWHSVVVTSDGVNVYLYIDGILNDSASLGAITDVNFGEDLYLFSIDGTQSFYNGKIQQVMLSDTPMDYDEVSLHYARMQEGLGGATALLSDDNVKTIEVDGDSGYAIVTAGNTSHIMNTQTGLFYSTDLVDSGVLRHADILSMSESFTPHYIMGSSTCIEQVAPSTTVLNGGVPLTGNQSGNSALSSFEISWPEEYSTSYDAHKIYFNDVKNSQYCWNWDSAKRDFRNKSWYNELGNPPSHGFLVVDSAQNSMQWVNRSYGTDGVSFFGSFMLFVTGGNNIISGNIVEAKFIDFKLYIATSDDGVCVIDFLQDKGYKINASGYYIYNGNITDRNAGSGWLQLSSALKIVNSNTTSIDVIRDPDAKEDIFARPLHYWAVGTGAGLSIYKPNSGNSGVVYDSANINPVFDVSLVGNIIVWSTDETNDTVSVKNHYPAITSDTWAADFTINSSKTDWTKTFFSGSEILSDLSALYGSNGEDIIMVGSNEGLSLRKDINGNGKEIGITDTYVTPTMKGDRVVSYPLNDLNDRSGYGRNLTSVGLTFTNNSPFGILSAGTGAGVYGEWNDVGVDFEGVAISLFFKSDDASNGLKETILSLKDSTGTDGMVELFTDSNGYLNALWSTDHTAFVPNTSDTIVSVGDIHDGQWHHIYLGQIEGDQTNWYLFVDGHQVGSVAITTATFNNNYVGIGLDAAGGDAYTGDVANVFVGNTSWSTNDIEFEYNRMLSALAGTSTSLLSASDVDSIEIDEDSGYAIITAGDSAHIMDTKNGMILSVDPLGVGTLNHADILSLPESDNPHYLLGGASAIEQIAPSTSVLNGGIPSTSNSSALNSIINAFFLMGA